MLVEAIERKGKAAIGEKGTVLQRRVALEVAGIICRSDFTTRNKDGCKSSSPKVPSVKMVQDLPFAFTVDFVLIERHINKLIFAPTLICPPPHIIFIRPPMKVANKQR
jgi:hypothetical protein